MKGTQGVGAIRKSAIVVAAALGLGGCLSEENNASWTEDYPDDVVVSGSVGDGPVINATVRITSSKGKLLAELQSDVKGAYNVTLQADPNQYPLLVEAVGGTDLVTNRTQDFDLRSAVLSTNATATANVNPFSTLAFETARDLNGGLTRGNLRKAQDIVAITTNSGLTSLKRSGPIESRVDAQNVAEMVKASETLSEIVRRTRNALNAAGANVRAGVIIERLGSDLIDELIEGNGGPRADARTAAVATIVSAQVLLESMSNELHVNGNNATEAMRAAIDQVSPGTAQPTLDDLAVTREMLDSTRIGALAAFAVTNDPELEQLAATVVGIQPGMDPVLVNGLLPSGYRSMLNAAIAMAAGGDATTVATINDVVRSGGDDDTPVANRPPVVSGTPAGSVTVGEAYDFTPSASDLDGDELTFSIDGKPPWAAFSTTTGSLSGTPNSNHVGIHGGIEIRVSDGQASSSIGPFSITVNEPAPMTGSITLNWTPPTENEDGSTLTDLARYRIHWGTTAGSYPNKIRIDNPGISSYVIDNLAPGTYFIVATSINAAGVESRYSNAITRAVP